MIERLQFTLMVGPVIAVTAPRAVLDALVGAEVTVSAGAVSVFSLTFRIEKNSPLGTLFLLAGGGAAPPIRVILVATVNGSANVLIDGIMTHHQYQPSAEEGGATLTIIGEDLTKVMDFIDFSGIPYPAMPPEARIALIVAKYAPFGMIPMVIPSLFIDVPIPTDRIPRHQGTDLAYIRQLADEVGYVFYIKPGPEPGLNVAYWGPEIRIGAPQPALTMDMGADTNVESINVSYQPEERELPVAFIHNALTKAPIPIPVPDIAPLRPPLGVVPPIPKNIRIVDGVAKLSPLQAAARALARSSETSDSVTVDGSLDVARYGHVLKARELVGVRGVGEAFDGLYYVKSVTHRIGRGSLNTSFALARDGLLSIVSRVPA